MLSTYVTWILVLLALGAGAWVLIRPSGGARSNTARPDSTPAGEAQTPEAVMPDEGRAPPRATQLHAVNNPQRLPGEQPPVVPPAVDRPRGEPPLALGSGGQTLASGGPGLGDMPPMPPLGMWSDGYAQSVRERWRDLQLRFIDDPHEVANEAERVVDETVEALTASLNSFKKDLDAWRNGPGDTEQLRAAVHRYRDFLDRLLGA